MEVEKSSNNDSVSSATVTTCYPTWHSAVAGGVAGFGSRMVTAPLDLIRIRRQLNVTQYPSESLWKSWQNIVDNEGGVKALYRGNMAAIYLWVGYAAMQFTVYNSVRDVLRQHRQRDDYSATATAFIAGATAGVCATLATYPFDVCRTTFSARGFVQQTADATTAAAAVPPPPLVAAVLPRQPLPFSSLCEPHLFPHHHPAAPPSLHTANITVHSAMHRSSLPLTSLGVSVQSVIHRNPIYVPIPSVPAGAVAVAVVDEAPPPPRTFAEFTRHLYRLKGWSGFYAGSWPAVIQIIPYMGLNFAIYDWIVTPHTNAETTTSTTTAVVGLSAYAGSLSGAVSKICVYPLDTVKRRLQAQAFFAQSPPRQPPLQQYRHYYYTGLWHCITTIYQKEGFTSFYRGMVPSVLKTAISSSLTFAFFRWTKTHLDDFHDNRHSHH